MSAVLIAGGGVAALEAALALRDHGGEQREIEVLAPDDRFVYRPHSVVEAFGGREAWSHDLDALLGAKDVVHRRGALRSVDAEHATAVTADGEELPYDALLVAVGSRMVAAIPGAVTFAGHRDVPALRDVLADLEAGQAESVAFAVPPGIAWPLPLYELALLTRSYLRGRDVAPRIEIVTPEGEPLALFGTQPSADMRALLERHEIGFRTGYPYRFADGVLQLVPEDSIAVDRVVAAAVHRGPWIEGLPADHDGFLPVDQFGAVRGVDGVWAAGDATDFPIKQGGVAAQQADAAATAISHRLGSPVEPRPFRPVLRGIVVGGDEPRHLHGEPSGGRGEPPAASTSALWWPPAKVAGRRLAPFLAAHGAPRLPEGPRGGRR